MYEYIIKTVECIFMENNEKDAISIIVASKISGISQKNILNSLQILKERGYNVISLKEGKCMIKQLGEKNESIYL